MKFKIGFDVGGTEIKAGIIDGDFNIISKTTTAFPKGADYRHTVKLMQKTATRMIEEKFQGGDAPDAIGIAVAGTINPSKDAVIKAVNLGFYNVPMKREMELYYPGVPIGLINDADAAALAEHTKGALKGYNSALLITIGTGMGSGLILNGGLYGGGLGHGVEAGHVTLALGKEPCHCGNYGCIETLCAASWFTKKTGSNAKTIIDAAKQGETKSLEIFEEYIENLSSAIASLTALLDPEIIAIGGGVSLAGDFLFNPLREKVRQKSFFKYPYNIVPAKLGNDAGMIGAAISVQMTPA